MKICLWCKGRKFLRIDGKKITCLNCHGSGVGGDGGRKSTSVARRKLMMGNKRQRRGR